MKKILCALLLFPLCVLAAPVSTQQTDVVIIGAGVAGLSAALAAKDLGVSVIVVEKSAMPGGVALLASGGISAAATGPQAERHIDDSVALMYEEAMNAGEGDNDGDLMHVLCAQSAGAISWLMGLGADLNDVGVLDNTQKPRAHRPTQGVEVGPEIVRALYAQCVRQQIEFRFMTEVSAITKTRGVIDGVLIKDLMGKESKIQARAVINAAGGFSGNESLLSVVNPQLKDAAILSQSHAMGEGVLLNRTVGGAERYLNRVEFAPTVTTVNRLMVSERLREKGAILVNQQGVRFVNELNTGEIVADAIRKQSGAVAYLIFDENVRHAYPQVDKLIRQGVVKEAKTVMALASQLGLPQGQMGETLREYEFAQSSKKDTKFHRATLAQALKTPDYYGIIVAPAVLSTLGGIRINPVAQVLDENGKTILGYYAAGEVTGGVHGRARLGGNALTDAVVFGRIAGHNAAVFSKK